jgi:hypothetical protein
MSLTNNNNAAGQIGVTNVLPIVHAKSGSPIQYSMASYALFGRDFYAVCYSPATARTVLKT